MSRIPYPDLDNLPRLAKEALNTLPAPLNLVTMSAHSPMLVAPLVSLGTTILARLHMSPRDREIVVLLTATDARCEYVLVQHRTMAGRLGLTDAEIDALCSVPADLSVFDPSEHVLIDATRQVLTTTTVDVPTVVKLRSRWSDAELVEFFFVVGHYRMISGLLNGLEVDVDPNGDVYAQLSERRGDFAAAGEVS